MIVCLRAQPWTLLENHLERGHECSQQPPKYKQPARAGTLKHSSVLGLTGTAGARV